MDKITLTIDNGLWIAIFSGPHAVAVESLFNSAAIPTPYTAATPRSEVLANVQRLNPGIIVELAA